MTVIKVTEEIKSAIKQTNLAYLNNYDECFLIETKEDLPVCLHGVPMADGTFVKCLQGSAIFPKGSKAWVFENKRYSYDKYIWIGDEQYPAKDAKRFYHGSDFTLIAIMKIYETEVIVDAFKSVDLPEKALVLG